MIATEATATRNVKAQTKILAENLNEDADWDDVLYEIYVRQSIEAGLRDIEAGRTITTEELRRRLGMPA